MPGCGSKQDVLELVTIVMTAFPLKVTNLLTILKELKKVNKIVIYYLKIQKS